LLWIGINLQNIVTTEGRLIRWIIDFNFFFLIFILLLVGGFLVSFYKGKFLVLNLYENYLLEIVWTILPRFVLIALGIPRLKLLYILELTPFFDLTLKTTGLQWFWKYNYNNFNNYVFDSFLKRNNLSSGEPRLLEAENHLILPLGCTHVIVGSEDVLHSWAIPSLGVKADANPGRLNSIYLNLKIPGIFYGQCSEICGANHSFIPITLEVTLLNQFISWLKTLS